MAAIPSFLLGYVFLSSVVFVFKFVTTLEAMISTSVCMPLCLPTRWKKWEVCSLIIKGPSINGKGQEQHTR